MRLAAISLILSATFVALIPAQESTARLLGTVKDPTGAVVPRATITVRNADTGLERRTAPNEAGDYSIPLLPIGQYTVTVESAGFKTSTISGLSLQVNQEA